jgi:surfactin synthase thioesterase subunit
MHEAPVDSIPTLVEAITAALSPHLDRPYAFFGHSMGAVLALEVAQALEAAGRQAPSQIFLSARRPPHLPKMEQDLHTLPDEAFLAELGNRYGGVPAEVLEHQDLLDLLLPPLRADITALETFKPPERRPMASALTAFGGDEDRFATVEQLRAWRVYTSAPFRVRMFRGGHFYLDTARSELLSDIAQALTPLISAAAAGRAPA